MSDKYKNDGFFNQVSNFFKRVNNQDLIKVGGKGGINVFDAPQTKQDLKTKMEFQVLRQFLQQKNWNLRHIELYDEYRRMDSTYPIIHAALSLYAQEVCLTGDTKVSTMAGDFTIKELYDLKKKYFLVRSFNPSYQKIKTYCECSGVKSNGIKKVYEVVLNQNVDLETLEWDTKFKKVSFKCTDNHKIYVGYDYKNQTSLYSELKNLKVGDTISSFYDFIDPSCNCKEQTPNKSTILEINYVGEEEVYDLLNVSPYHHFAIKLTDSVHAIVHNCSKDAEGNIFKLSGEDSKVLGELEDCYYDNLKLDSRAYLLVRSMMKFGNSFSYVQSRRGVGVTDLIQLPPESIRINLLDNDDRLDLFRYNWYGYGGNIEFEPWEVVHWKIIQDIESEPYGQSILRSVVETWRRIILMREALIIYRITRAPQRFLYKIDTTGLDPDAALRHAQNVKEQLTRKPMTDPKTGEMDYRYMPMSVTDDIYQPTFEGDVGDVRVLEGASNIDAVEDYKIIKDDLFAGLLIPKAYLTFEEDLCVRANTIVKTTEGKLEMQQIASLFEKNDKLKIYTVSCDEKGFITQGKILWCKPTKEVTSLHRIHLSNNRFEDVTENHPFLTEDLIYVRADELVEGVKIRNIYNKDITVTKVEIIELEQKENVYDLEVEKHHNFALDSGIFVHNSNKAALAQEDMRFSNAVRQYQSYFVEGLLHIGLVHLYLKGHDKEDLESFSIEMNNSSTLVEKNRNDLLQQRIDLAKSALDTGNGQLTIMSYTDVLRNIMHFTEEEISRTFKNQFIEKKIAWRLQQISEQGFYEEPDIEKRKAKMKDIEDTDDVFKELQFESKDIDHGHLIEMIKDKVDKEIEILNKNVKVKPSKKQVNTVIALNEDKIKGNIKKTFLDLGLNLEKDF